MKLNDLIPNRRAGRIVQHFGAAQLIRRPDGTHQLIGGNGDDLAAAHEWVSLFAHDIVFSAAQRQPIENCRVRRKKISPRWKFTG